jgi:hypothetical protein
MTRILSAALLGALVELQACSAFTADRHVLENVTIREYTAKPPLSGVLATYIGVRGSDRDGDIFDLLVPHLTEDVALPPVSSVCDVFYTVRDIHGLVGLRTEDVKGARVVDRFVRPGTTIAC